MLSARYYRHQAQIFLKWAAAASDSAVAKRLREQANEFSTRAAALDESEAKARGQQQQQPKQDE
jgi:hypothetical protein